MFRRGLAAGVAAAALLVSSILGGPTAGAAGGPVAVWDDFAGGFTVGAPGSAAKWFYFGTPDGSFVGDDGVAVVQGQQLTVTPPGRNARTGQPAFGKTVAQEQTSGLPGGLDHVKWLIYMNHFASTGQPGFDALPGQKLVCESTVSGQVYGSQFNPFVGAIRANPSDDLRLASIAMNVIDFESYMVFDVFYTNAQIYAFYERLPFGRTSMGGTLGEYAAFSYAIPLVSRTPGDEHTVAVSFDKSAGVVSWSVDGVERFRTGGGAGPKLGQRIDRQYMLLDHGGPEVVVSPNQLDCGMGMFTLLDGHGATDRGLVRISSTPGFYFNPSTGEPNPEQFVDPASSPGSRLFGQGATIGARRPSVGYR